MFLRSFVPGACLFALLAASSSAVRAQDPPPKQPLSELDAFMERALARRDVNRKVMNDYILDEKESFEILGPGRMRLHRTNREYTWFVREGIHVRSPLRFEGVSVPEESRVRYEENWLRRERARAVRRAEREKAKARGETPPPEDRHVTISPTEISTNALPIEPQFVSAAYFMDFKFEPGNYYLAGRETLEGQEVVKVEYYPTRMFDDDDSPEARKKDRGQKEEDELLRKMNKTALVTLWIDPKIHQIVKYEFQNVWLDFLPAAWLVRVDGMRASMAMFQPFPGIWLPRGMEINAGITLANGSFEASYERRFADYRQAEVKSRLRVPKAPEGVRPLKGPDPLPPSEDDGSVRGGGPYAPATVDDERLADDEQQTGSGPEFIREVRVHGNAAVPDADVLKIAGLTLGAAVEPNIQQAVERRLKDSGKFESIDVRKRYRSLSDPTDVAIVLVVHEKTGVVVTPSGKIERPISKRIASRIMFLPILNYADGYGLTYGARFSTVDLLGMGERVSLPLTWGGTRRIALELERTFKRGPLTRILGSAGLWQRENPGWRFEPDDDDSTTDRRLELKARAERNFAQLFVTGVEATRARVDFGPFPRSSQWTIGADAALDTRSNPAFPSNAVYLGAAWNQLHYADLEANRITYDARGYLRLIRQPVLAGRVQYFTSDGPLPVHERWLVGGSSTLRGFRTGELNGTKALVTSVELRVPITSVVSGGKFGFTAFMDAAKVGDEEFDIRDARWQRGAGGGLFLIASVFKLNLDVARELRKDGGVRVHLSSGFSF